jgi:ABC-2 type transport system ATP-binding protein
LEKFERILINILNAFTHFVHAIEVRDIWRIFKGKDGIVEALKGVNLYVKKGEIFGLLGPNGAGKTTLIRILTTLLLPTKGEAYVLGYDVTKEENKIRPHINMVSGGEYSGYGLLTVQENIWMFSQLYGMPSDEAKEKIKNLAKELGFENILKKKVRTLSTGQRQKMNIARGFITDPQIIFLDEPTLGLDVEVARDIRNFIKKWLMDNPDRTVFLTTHYMHEAEMMCDRIAIINYGKIVAIDTPENLKKMVGKEYALIIKIQPKIDMEWIREIDGVINYIPKEIEGGLKIRMIASREEAIGEVMEGILKRNAKIVYLNKEEPTLEDVFLKLTGRGLE